MKAVISACVFAVLTTVAVAAPYLIQGQLPQDLPIPEQQQPIYRQQRSSYPPAFYASAPCASAGIPAYASLPAVGPAAAYQVNLAPGHSAAIAPHGFGYGIPQYRDADEMMQFSDMDHTASEHVPMARYGYGAPGSGLYTAASASAASGAALSGVGGQILSPAVAAAPSYGVFPTGNTGGCSIPLLLSCAPTIVPGKLVQTHGQHSYGTGAAVAGVLNSYRGVDEHHELQTPLEHPVDHEHQPHATHEPLDIHQ